MLVVPVTLTLKFDLGIVKAYLYTKNEGSRSRLSKVRAQTGQTLTDTQTDRQTDKTKRSTTPHSLVIIKTKNSSSSSFCFRNVHYKPVPQCCREQLNPSGGITVKAVPIPESSAVFTLKLTPLLQLLQC